MWIAIRSEPIRTGKLNEKVVTQNSTFAGSSETEVNEFTVSAATAPSAVTAVTAVTPVGKCPHTWRNSAVSNRGSAIIGSPPGRRIVVGAKPIFELDETQGVAAGVLHQVQPSVRGVDRPDGRRSAEGAHRASASSRDATAK